MNRLILCSISDDYINYLRSDKRLKNVYDNKEDTRTHTRKYLGIVLDINNYNYYVPLSSPKESDFVSINGVKTIRKSIIPIIRIITPDKNGNPELKGTLRLSNMIAVPDNVITPYVIKNELDTNYKTMVEKEYDFIVTNQDEIRKNAKIIYNQKTKENILYSADFSKKPKYLNDTLNYKLTESKCIEYCKQANFILQDPTDCADTISNILIEYEQKTNDTTIKPNDKFTCKIK